MTRYTDAGYAQAATAPLPQAKAGFFSYLAIAFMPLALLDIRLPLPGMEVRLSDFYLLTMFAVFLLRFSDALTWTIRTTYLFVPFLLYILIYSLVMGNTGGVVEFIQWSYVLLWVPVLSYVLRDADEAMIRLLMFSLMAVAVYVALSHIANGDLVRYKSMGDAKYTFGLFGLLSTLCLLRYKRLRYWPPFLLSLVLMGLSLERNGMVIYLATMLFIVPLMALRAQSFYTATAIMIAKVVVFTSGFIAYFLLFGESMSVTHFLDEEQALWESNLHRANLIANGVEIYFDHPWFGVGGKMLRQYMDQFYINSELALYTHNWYLDFFVEYGLIGVVLFLLAVVPAIFNLSVKHKLAWAILPLTFYCFMVPVFMANGTTTMLIYLTGVACCRASSWRGVNPARV